MNPGQASVVRIQHKISEGELLFVIGAGASINKADVGHELWESTSNRFPYANEFAHYLAQEFGVPIAQWHPRPRDVRAIQVELAASGETASKIQSAIQKYTERSLSLDKVASAIDEGKVAEKINSCFSMQVDLRPVHHYLPTVTGNPLIITTNYDRLIERGFKEAGKPYMLIVYDVGNKGNKPLWIELPTERGLRPYSIEASENIVRDNENLPLIFKIHGTLEKPCVVSQRDYFRIHADMYRGRLWPFSIGRKLYERDVLVYGYGMGDWTVRMLLCMMHEPTRRLRGFSPNFNIWEILDDEYVQNSHSLPDGWNWEQVVAHFEDNQLIAGRQEDPK